MPIIFFILIICSTFLNWWRIVSNSNGILTESNFYHRGTSTFEGIFPILFSLGIVISILFEVSDELMLRLRTIIYFYIIFNLFFACLIYFNISTSEIEVLWQERRPGVGLHIFTVLNFVLLAYTINSNEFH